MKGLSAETIDPLSNTPREQAIILLLRTYKKFSTTTAQTIEEAGTVRFEKPPAISKNNREKFEFTMITNNIFFPKFDKKLDLFVSNKAGKPSNLPSYSITDNESGILFAAVNPIISSKTLVLPASQGPMSAALTTVKPTIPNNIITSDSLEVIIHPPVQERTREPVYINSDFGAFIDKNENSVRWFSYKLSNIRGLNTVSKIIWQVSESQFIGTKDRFNNEAGIVLSGEVLPTAKEFSIDFSKIKPSVQAKNPIKQDQKTYYVRAFPVDSSGKPIGDPGTGIAVLYGIPAMSDREITEAAFEIWTPKSHMGGGHYETGLDDPVHDPNKNGNIVDFDPKQNNSRYFHFHGLDEGTKKIYVQVYNEDFDKNQTYLDYENLVYEREYNVDDLVPISPHTDLDNSITLDFKLFGKPASEMKAGEYIKYYLRAVAITEDTEPGKLRAIYSDIVTVNYGFEKPVTIIAPPAPPSKYSKTQMINYSLPSIEIVGYTAIDWADPDYMSRYYVHREPKATEITCSWRNSSGKILRPYKYYLMTNELGNFSSFVDPLSAQYEMLPQEFKTKYEKLIKEVLPVGAEIYIPKPVEEDKPWYKELFDGVVNFFKDLVSVIMKIYTKITQAYENIKTKLIMAVASLCPIPELRDEFAMALRSLVDYGLSSIGIPPKFPNFEQMAEGNIAYLAQVALTEAGVPANEITEAMTEEAAKGILNKFKEADKESYDENPVGAPFLKLDPKALYQPACLEVELVNDTDYPTVPGTLDLNVEFRLNEQGLYATSYDPVGLNLTADTYEYSYNPYTASYSAQEYWKHFVYGLNGYTVDYKNGGIWDGVAIYEVFAPVVDLKLPVVPANSSVRIKIYLEPGGFSLTSRYPDAEPARYEDFYNMYQNNGNADYTWFKVTTSFPEAREYYSKVLVEKGVIGILDPKTDYRYHMDNSYGSSQGREIQMPVNIDW